jgi:aryl-alcohol dehydrogenase-like predicted oxidoreductase
VVALVESGAVGTCGEEPLLVPGTSSIAHLRENVAAAAPDLPPEAAAALDAIAG